MNEVLGIDIDILILFLLVSICIGMYLNLIVFDRMATLTQDMHDAVTTVTDVFRDIVHIESNRLCAKSLTLLEVLWVAGGRHGWHHPASAMQLAVATGA